MSGVYMRDNKAKFFLFPFQISGNPQSSPTTKPIMQKLAETVKKLSSMGLEKS